ncbi:defective in tip formation protein A-like [Panonychus citri]|uniref:defective in tip formation protein A-like n=1 Tax=Panonychus citri TaxID=50023 RepID=UPI00230742CE|nr:defective in tip formation protein A-like [Panonychus citri]
MYAIPKGPATNKVLVKSRRSLPPRMDSFENNRGNMKNNRRENYPINDLNSPRHVYHNSSSGKKTYHHHHYPRESRVISPQHQEMISYIHGNWEGVMRQYESDAQLHQNIPISGKRLPRVAYYKHNDNLSRHSPNGEIGNRDSLGSKDLPPQQQSQQLQPQPQQQLQQQPPPPQPQPQPKHSSSSTRYPTMNLPK